MKTLDEWQRAKTLFNACLQLDAAARAELLGRECADAPGVRAEAESLLASAAQAITFLEQPAAEQALAGLKSEQWVGRRLGAYQIVALLAAGGMGEVYRAVRADDQYQQEVAIKLVRRGLQGEFTLARFKAERQILATLDHPNIARLLDAGLTEEGQPYFVMQLIEGEPIDRYCEDHALSVKERLNLFCEVCAAVQYAHQNLTVHRDLKPANILVTREGVPKLLDFGIAKVLDADADQPATVTAMWAMTPEYSSPEQVRGEPITTASDIYSLGVILYRLLTGQSPYRATQAEPYALAKEVCDTEPARPSAIAAAPGSADATTPISRKQLAGDLDSIVLMTLRKEPQRRYASVPQLVQDIRRHLEGLPVSAAQDSWCYRAGKFVQRHRGGVLAAAVALLALAIGISAIVSEGQIARTERQRADRRFNDVRKLANVLIFDLEEAIEPLPGSTAARKLLVDKALQYLDTLAQEAKGDVTLQRELAAAYQKLGTVQGGASRANLGESESAQRSFEKALAIREYVARANPNNLEDQLALAMIFDLYATQSFENTVSPQAGLDYEQKALAIVEPLAKKYPSNVKVLDLLGTVYEVIGSIQGGTGSSANLGNLNAAIEYHRKALATAEALARLQPGNRAGRHTIANLSVNLADDFVRKGDRAQALEIYRASENIYKSEGTDHLTPHDVHLALTLYQRLGNVQMMDGDAKAAMESYQAALELDKRAVAADPKNALARTDLYIDEAVYGVAIAKMGRVAEGLAVMSDAIAHLESERARDPKSYAVRILAFDSVLRGQVQFEAGKFPGAMADFRSAAAIFSSAAATDPQAKIALAAVDSKIADVLAKQGDHGAARDLYEGALATLEPLATMQHPLVEVLYTTADTYTGLGDLELVRAAAQSANTATKIEHLKEARNWLSRSANTWQKVPNPGRFNPSGFSTDGPSKVAARLTRCDAELKALSAPISALNSTSPWTNSR